MGIFAFAVLESGSRGLHFPTETQWKECGRLEGNLASGLCHFILDCVTSCWLCSFRLVPKAESERVWL